MGPEIGLNMRNRRQAWGDHRAGMHIGNSCGRWHVKFSMSQSELVNHDHRTFDGGLSGNGEFGGGRTLGSEPDIGGIGDVEASHFDIHLRRCLDVLRRLNHDFASALMVMSFGLSSKIPEPLSSTLLLFWSCSRIDLS